MLTWDRSFQMSKLFKLFYLFKLLLDFFLRRTHTHTNIQSPMKCTAFFSRESTKIPRQPLARAEFQFLRKKIFD